MNKTELLLRIIIHSFISGVSEIPVVFYEVLAL